MYWKIRYFSRKHSINRVKSAQAFAEQPHFNRQRAARLWIDCRIWLGTWGTTTPYHGRSPFA